MKEKVKELNDDTLFFHHADESGQFFSAFPWCSAFDDRLKKIAVCKESGELMAGLVAFEAGRSYARTLITPPCAPNCGWFINQGHDDGFKGNDFRKKCATLLAEYLRSSHYAYFKLDFPTDWIDMQPFIWQDMMVEVKYTYQLKLKDDDFDLKKAMDSKLRNMIHKAERESATVDFVSDSKAALSMIEQGLESKKVNYDKRLLQRIISQGLKKGIATQVNVRLNNELGYCGIIWRYNSKAYYIFGGIDRTLGNNALSAFGLYHLILKAREFGLEIFDFEGSMIIGIEKFFRGFGGDLIPYYSVSGGKSLWPAIIRRRQKKF